MSERLNVKIAGLYGYHGGEEMNELRERVHSMIRDPYNSHNGDERLRERVMHIINSYRTPNNDIVFDRRSEYLGLSGGRHKNYNINRIGYFKDIPDGVEVLVDYVDVTAIRTMNIPSEIIYESIYRELPELFEE